MISFMDWFVFLLIGAAIGIGFDLGQFVMRICGISKKGAANG